MGCNAVTSNNTLLKQVIFHEMNDCRSVSAHFYSSDHNLSIFSLYRIAMTSHELNDVWNHQHLDELFNSFFGITTRQTAMQYVTRWHKMLPYVILMTYEIWTLCHLRDLALAGISSGLLTTNTVCHPDDLRCYRMSSELYYESWNLCRPNDLYPGGISFGWPTTNAVCHPDDLGCYPMSCGWLNSWWYLIWMTYDQCSMSFGWLKMLPYVIRMT